MSNTVSSIARDRTYSHHNYVNTQQSVHRYISGFKRFLAMLLVALFTVPNTVLSTAIAAETDLLPIVEDMPIPEIVKELDKRGCGAEMVSDESYKDFTHCNYIAGGFISTHVDPEGEAGTFSTSDSKSAGYNLLIGRQFTPRWFGEFSYADLGEATLSTPNPRIADETISYKIPTLHVGYLLRPANKRLNFFVKGGVSAISNEASSDTVPFDKVSNIQGTFGLGAQWQSPKSGFFVRLGSDFFDRDAIAVGLSLGYRFRGSTKTYSR